MRILFKYPTQNRKSDAHIRTGGNRYENQVCRKEGMPAVNFSGI